MNKYFTAIALKTLLAATSVLSLVSTTGCKEESLAPSHADINFFEVDDDDRSVTGELRRSFFAESGCYLLFDATLRKGDVTKELNINYGVTKEGKEYYDSELIRYVYIDDDADRIGATTFIREKVLPYMSKDRLPYSLLLVDTIVSYNYDKKLKTYNMEKPDKKKVIIHGLSVTAIAGLKGIQTKDEGAQQKQQKEILSAMIRRSLSLLDESAFEVFYSVSLPYYDKSYDKDSADMPDVKDLKELGFLKAYSFRPKERMSFYPKDKDKSTFINELLSAHESVWRTKYAEYPLVLTKLDALKKLLDDMGYNLDYLKA
ncbi:hypothetical protein [Porphyromonas sp.]|uniref:hypothetical protein n=1 Tax=Porphyromonas sp. TaxID=1924944 RepID=UPI0026DACDA1|nr:hypothetical protein [Porphyromonas sp.]MDO4771367.1 hypothetical protein [Porphyromonas sp.]